MKSHEAVSHFDPYLLAERLDYTSTAEAQFSKVVDGEAIMSIWRRTESLIAERDPQGPLDARLETCYFDALHIAENGDTPRHKIRARMFLANFHLLALRTKGHKIEAEDIRRSYSMMADNLETTLNEYSYESMPDNIAEMVTYALIARHGDPMNAPFVTSSRERRSSHTDRNHTLYTVDDDVTIKTAVRVRSRWLRAEQATPYLYAHYSEDFLSKYAGKLEAVQKRRALEPEKALNEIVAEIITSEPDDGYASDSPEAACLSTLSKHLIAQLDEHRLQLIGGSTRPKAVDAMKKMATAIPKPRPVQQIRPAQPKKAPATATPRVASIPAPASTNISNMRTLSPEDCFLKHHGRTFINPYLSAESIPPEVLEKMTFGHGEHIMGPLWRDIEIGLTTHDAKKVMAARDKAHDIADDDSQEALLRTTAAMAAVGGRLLVRRAMAVPATKMDIWESFCDMADVLHGLQHSYGTMPKEDRIGRRAEILSYCLVAYRKDRAYVPYLGSYREEKSPIFIANHDLYTMPARSHAVKLAAQIKNNYSASHHQRFGTPEKPRHTFMFPIYLRNVLQRQAFNMGAIEHRNRSTQEAARLILCAARGELSEQDTAYLHGYSSSVIKLFAQHRDHLRIKKKWHKMPFSTAASSEEYIAGL